MEPPEAPLTEISGDAPPFVGRVGGVAFLGEGDLLVQDRQSAELRSFGPDGQVLRLLAGKGDGPGETRSLTQLSVTPGDTVYAFDGRHDGISVFGPGDGFLTTIPVRPEFADVAVVTRDSLEVEHVRVLAINAHGNGR